MPYSSSGEGFDLAAGFSAAFAASAFSAGCANDPSGFATAFAVAAVAVAAVAFDASASAFFASAAFFAARSLSYFALRSEKLSVFCCFFSPSATFDKASSGFLNGSSEFGS